MSKTILVLSSEEDCHILNGILGEGYDLIRVQGDEAREAVEKLMPPVIICEACVHNDWRQVIEMAREARGRPLVIICGELGNSQLWVEAINFGAHDILSKPFEAEEVERVVGIAVDRKQRKYLHTCD